MLNEDTGLWSKLYEISTLFFVLQLLEVEVKEGVFIKATKLTRITEQIGSD